MPSFLIGDKTEAQISEPTCSWSQSCWVAEPGLKFSVLNFSSTPSYEYYSIIL